jgi:PBSX family phage portal protein
VSKQVDPFTGNYDALGLVSPPYGDNSYDIITYRYDNSDALQSAIDAMVTNVCAFGVQCVGYASDLPPDALDEITDERKRIQARLDQISSIGSFNAVRKRVRRDHDLFGDGYYEVIRDPSGALVGLEHIPAGTMRKSRLSKQPVPMRVWQRGPDGVFTRVVVWRRVRRYTQRVDGQYQWFKEFGDPRPLRGDTGEEDPNASPDVLANEVINLCHYEPDGYNLTPYGKPRWRGAAPDIAGRAAAASVNADIFDQKGIPPMAILVQGAQFDDEVIKRITEQFVSLKGRSNFHAPLILEAVGADAGTDASDPAGITRPGAVPKIDFKDLTKATPSDAQFLAYRKDCIAAVRMAFRIPGLFMGQSDEYNFATAQTARTVTEEQVFQPERSDEDDLYNVTLVPELGARWTKFQTKGPPLLDETTLLKVLEFGAASGALTVENVSDLLEPILRMELSSAAAWRKLPVRVLRALADKALLPKEVLDIVQGKENIINVAGTPGGAGAGGAAGLGGLGPDTTGMTPADGEGTTATAASQASAATDADATDARADHRATDAPDAVDEALTPMAPRG